MDTSDRKFRPLNRHNRILGQICNETVAEFVAALDRNVSGLTVSPQWLRYPDSLPWEIRREIEMSVTYLLYELEFLAMASTGRKSKRGKGQIEYSFVRCELTAEDKKDAKIWIDKHTHDLGAIAHDVMAEDYKLTCSFSSEHDTFTACLVGKEGNALNEGKTLTARHKDWITAILTVLYKHLVMFQAKTWETDDADDSDGWA